MLALMSVADAGGAGDARLRRGRRRDRRRHRARRGRAARTLADSRQVLCITHLPQVASLAARHFRVVKRDGCATRAPMLPARRSSGSSDGELVAELCRMLGADCRRRGGTPTRRAAAPGRVESRLRRGLRARAGARPPALVCIESDTRLPATSGLSPSRALVPEVRGTARLGKRTKDLVQRLTPDDIAIIDHRDLDRMAAEDLVECGVQAVVNVASSTTGRYPNPGPLILTRAGVRLVDAVGAPLFEKLTDGDPVTAPWRDRDRARQRRRRGHGARHRGADRVAREQQRLIGEAIEDFAENTLTHIREERELLAGRLKIPTFDTDFRDRHALIVVRGTDYRRDLRAIPRPTCAI